MTKKYLTQKKVLDEVDKIGYIDFDSYKTDFRIDKMGQFYKIHYQQKGMKFRELVGFFTKENIDAEFFDLAGFEE